MFESASLPYGFEKSDLGGCMAFDDFLVGSVTQNGAWRFSSVISVISLARFVQDMRAFKSALNLGHQGLPWPIFFQLSAATAFD
jgi:hypothetical protein